MENNEGLKVKGKLEIFDLKRNLLYSKNNIITDTGIHWMIDGLKIFQNPISHIAIGTGTSPASATDVALQTEIIRKQITDIDTISNVLTAEVQIEDYEANTIWKECGMFNANIGGKMFNRISINFNKTNVDKVIVKFTITLNRV